MRYLLSFALLICAYTMKAQTFTPLSTTGYTSYYSFNSIGHYKDSVAAKKWFVTSYAGVSTGFMFYKGGSASYFAPVGALQLNRKLNNNLYAFANVTAAPAYLNFNGIGTNLSKVNGSNNFSRTGNLNISSSVNFGLMYVNDARTFSVSGSIGVERSSYPVMPYNQQNSGNQPAAVPSYR